jgi:PEP-CTERM motif
LFAATYGAAGYDDSWHLGTTLTVTFAAGLHTLYVGTIGASQQNDQAYVQFDNVSLMPAVPEPGTAALLASGGLLLLGLRRRRQ